MSDLLSRPLLRTGAELPEYPRPAIVGAAIAAGWAALAGALLCAAVAVIGWLGAEGGTAPDAVQVGLSAWLLAHRVPLALDGATFALAPLGLTAVPLLLLHRAGCWVAHTCAVRGRRDVVVASVMLAVGYGGLSALFAVVARSGGLGPHPGWAALGGGLLAGLAGGFGIVRRSHIGVAAWRRLPREAQASCYGGLAGFVTLAACGGLLLTAALVGSFDRAVAMGESLDAGIAGGVVVFLLCLAYLPNALVYAVAYACGPGFAVGAATTVTPDAVYLGPIPAFPLLAAVPGEPPSWGTAALVVPLLAGAVAGLVALRRRPVDAPEAAAMRGGLAGAAGGLTFAIPVLFSGGPAGPGRLSEVGPPPGEMALVLVVGLALSGAVAAAVVRIVAAYRVRAREAAKGPGVSGLSTRADKSDGDIGRAASAKRGETTRRGRPKRGAAVAPGPEGCEPTMTRSDEVGAAGVDVSEADPGKGDADTEESAVDDGIELPEFVTPSTTDSEASQAPPRGPCAVTQGRGVAEMDVEEPIPAEGTDDSSAQRD